MPSKEFLNLMTECIELHNKKSHDYSAEDSAFSNFDETANLVELFTKPIDQVFSCMIGIKISRLSQLLNGKTPLNESIDDSFKDLVNYCALWGSYYRKYKAGPQPSEYVPGQIVAVKASNVTKLPDICTDCNLGFAEQKINHAITMHSAEFNKAQATIKYPTQGLFLLGSDFWKREYK